MSTRETPWPAGTPCWVDLAVDDLDAARERYAHLFGWDTDDGAAGDYLVCLKNGRPAAGLMPKDGPEMPSAWTTYLATDDLDATLAAVTEAGGRVEVGATTPSPAGSFAVCTDPGGAVFGLWQPGERLGFGVYGEPGTVAWCDLLTRDLDGAREFYGRVFGYEFTEAGPGYLTFSAGEGTAGGMHLAGELPHDAAPHWLVHFAVADRDSTMALAEMEEGTEILLSTDTPLGPEAVVRGSEGEVFTVISPVDDGPGAR